MKAFKERSSFKFRMKLPKTFVPEKDLEKKILSLENGAADTTSLENLIFDPKIFNKYMSLNTTENSELSYVNAAAVEHALTLEYCPDNNKAYAVFVEILQFKDKSSLEKNFQSLLKREERMDTTAYIKTLHKGRYALFVYAFNGDIHVKNITRFYEQELGFKEV